MNQILSMVLRLLTRRAFQAGRRPRGRGRVAPSQGMAQKIRVLSRLLRR